MTPPTATTLRQYLDQVIEHTVTCCTQCGKCYEVCPMPRYSKVLAGKTAADVLPGVLGLLRNETADPASLEWVKLCTQSARCIPACPEGVDPMKMLRIARMSAYGSLDGPQQLEPNEDPQFFRRINAFAASQLSDDELATWHRGPP